MREKTDSELLRLKKNGEKKDLQLGEEPGGARQSKLATVDKELATDCQLFLHLSHMWLANAQRVCVCTHSRKPAYQFGTALHRNTLNIACGRVCGGGLNGGTCALERGVAVTVTSAG